MKLERQRAFSPDIIRRAATTLDEQTGRIAAIGFAESQRERVVSPNSIEYVDMNQSGKAELLSGQEGLLATSALGECTGIAGFAKLKDGSIRLMISHYDAMAQNSQLTGKPSPAVNDMYSFRYTSELVDGRMASTDRFDKFYVVAHPDSVKSDPNYGDKRKIFDEWHYLDQIETTISQLGDRCRVIEIPYQLSDTGHSLAAGLINGSEGIFWDGVQVNFDSL